MKKIFLLALFLLLFPIANAQVQKSTYQYAKIYLNPFYRSGMTQNVNYTYNITISPPDGVDKVESAIIFFQVYITPTVEFYLWVNNKSCNPPSFLVHTTYMDVGYSVIAFDCSNVIKEDGNYTVILQPRLANTGSIIGWLDLTYIPRKTSLNVFGTEYVPLSNGKVFVQYFDSYGNPINDAVCILDIFKPDNSPLFSKVVMNLLNQSDGIYYFDFVVPETEGVYPISVSCVSPSEISEYVANDFVIYLGSVTDGVLENTWNLDGLTHDLKAKLNVSYIFNYTYANFLNKLIAVDWYGFSAGGTVSFYFYNCSSGRFELLPNSLSGAAAGRLYRISNTVRNYTCQNFFILNIYADRDLKSDYIVIRLIQPYYIQHMRGGGEIHVTNISKHLDENLKITYYFELLRQKADELKNITSSIENKTNLTYDEVVKIKEKVNEIYYIVSIINTTTSGIKNDTEILKEMTVQLNETIFKSVDLLISKLEEIKDYLNSSFSELNRTLNASFSELNGTIWALDSKLNQMILMLEEIKNNGEITINKINMLMDLSNELKNITSSIENKTNLTYNEMLVLKGKINEIQEILNFINSTISGIKDDTEILKGMVVRLNETILESVDLLISRLEAIKDYLNSSFSELNGTLNSKLNQMILMLEEIKNNGEITINKINMLMDLSNELYNISNQTLNNSGEILLKIDEIRNILSELNISLIINITGSVENITESIKTLPIDVWKQFLKLGTPPLMPSTEYYCKDNTTLVKNLTFTFCENNKCDIYSKVEEINCAWGCDYSTNSCAPNPFYKYAIVVAVIVVIIVIVYLIRRRYYYY